MAVWENLTRYFDSLAVFIAGNYSYLGKAGVGGEIHIFGRESFFSLR